MSAVTSVDPRTGQVVETVAEETTVEEVDRLARQAAIAAVRLERLGRPFRAGVLRALADALDADRETIVALADRETGLGLTRLNGELNRTCYQFRLFADTVEEGGYLEAVIDHAADTPMGPRPDLRRMLVPIGPVGVFAASNFPLAFSAPGGDTASALAAGCPVLIKAHGSHPATAQRCYDVMSAAATRAGAPEGTLSIVYGHHAGTALVQHPAVKAVGFTGSLHGGRALADLAAGRPEPIPFYGELSSLNPVVITPAAAAERAEAIGKGLAGSATLGAGQFCTKPGIAFVPVGADGDRLRDAVAKAFGELDTQVALNGGIQKSYREGIEQRIEHPGVAMLASAGDDSGAGFLVRPTVFTTDTRHVDDVVTSECFGPTTILVSYSDDADLLTALRGLPGSLTATLHIANDTADDVSAVLDVLRHKAGRILFNGFPTGVAVSWAQQHGGPWPSTNTLHTSVGMTAVRRFLRPVAWQDAPQSVLPAELRDDPGGSAVPRRVDGAL
ncbi:MAG TPA: aldehyde dehydrogenase (NADP(+)) [Pseudonocardiaceae bacterium]|jgi:NADP-dependent aldehyde dehydrogenase|nr:aldehyde dehydrogenase (NADP(+)) [Pseudonocardiaceae bacterium]